MEETDKELLSIADKDKLQKLHRRFSSKTPSSRNQKSSRKIVEQSNRRNSSSPKDEAQLLFPGHQEFFYIFIMSANSYAFAMHLRSHLISVIIDKTSETNDGGNIEKRLLELSMFARFLGVLFFSPNWRSSETRPKTCSSCSKRYGRCIFACSVR